MMDHLFFFRFWLKLEGEYKELSYEVVGGNSVVGDTKIELAFLFRLHFQCVCLNSEPRHVQ